MLTTYLVAHPWLPVAALVALVLLGPPVGRRLAGRPRALRVLAGLAWLPVAGLTLAPTARRAGQLCEVAWSLPTPGRVELAANVVLLVAPVLLLGVLLRRPVVALVLGSGLSALVEVTQAVLPALGRSCATSDWLSNTIGAVLGAGLAAVALRGTSTSRRPAGRDRHPPVRSGV